MRLSTTLTALLLLFAPAAMAQQLEASLNPTPSTNLSDPFAIYVQNGARGLSGPWDLDRDGKKELLVAQHSGAGGLVHVFENTTANTWELVYSTSLIDSTGSDRNVRYAIGADLDNDGNWEIVTIQGNSYKAGSKTDSLASVGAYVWEHDGSIGSDNYGTKPASRASFYDLDGMTVYATMFAEQLTAADVDGDGQQELLVPANGINSHDIFYVLSVTGDYVTNGIGTTFETWGIELKAGPRLDGNLLGGGSPYAVYVADLNGDGKKDISFHSFNNFALFNATATGINTYALPTTSVANGGKPFIKVTAADQVALFGGAVADIDKDGNDEVFYANFFDNKVYVVDYATAEDVLEIEASNVSTEAEAIVMGSGGGVDIGDLDGDGNLEVLVGGSGYSASQFDAGTPSRFIRVAEYNGGDPKLGSSYTRYDINTGVMADSLGFHTIHRKTRTGADSTYHVIASSKQGSTTIASDPVFPSRIVYLGDADGDGDRSVALSFQGVDDSLYVYDEVWTNFPTGSAAGTDTSYYVRSVRQAYLNPRRDFVRIYSFAPGFVLNTDRIVMPDDYVLEGNAPNPFSTSTTIRFTLPIAKQISARIYDLQGRLVHTLIENELYEAGPHLVDWDGTSGGTSLASGVYVIRLEYGNFSQSRTLMLVK